MRAWPGSKRGVVWGGAWSGRRGAWRGVVWNLALRDVGVWSAWGPAEVGRGLSRSLQSEGQGLSQGAYCLSSELVSMRDREKSPPLQNVTFNLPEPERLQICLSP